MEPMYFSSPALFRRWLQQNAGRASELWVGYYKVGTLKRSVTWQESVDQALCFGWIDGIRKSVDEDRYSIRFTPRAARSVWSAVNIKRVRALIDQGLMQAAGLKAFAARRENRSGIYTYEQRSTELPATYAAQMRGNRVAAAFFRAQSPGYRKAAVWWVVSAKQESTRLRRLKRLIDDSATERRLPQFTGSSVAVNGTRGKKTPVRTRRSDP